MTQDTIQFAAKWLEITPATLEAAQDAALQTLLEEAGVSHVANDLNGAAYEACKTGDIDALWAAKGGCFAVVTFVEVPPLGQRRAMYGKYLIARPAKARGKGKDRQRQEEAKARQEEGPQGGQTLLDLAMSQGWDEKVQATLRQLGARQSSEPYTFRVIQFTASEEQSDGDDIAVQCFDLSGSVVHCAMMQKSIKAQEIVVQLVKAGLQVSSGQIIMPDGNMLRDCDQTAPLYTLLNMH